jgi:UDP-N-acetylmuramyl pentapeptide phosphotransferase/UDP-N-acetylglucosamine-1-phosphate transferase
LNLLLTALLAFAAAALVTRLMIPWLAERGAVATENERTMHSGVVPKGGGLALLIAFVLALLVFHPAGGLPPAIAAGLLLAAAVSWRDDIDPLPAAVRLPVHFAAAACVVLSLPDEARVFQGWLPLVADRAVTVFMLAGFMNFYNFMDGINGIAGTQAMAITGGYLLIGASGARGLELGPLAAALFGATAGFLIWNLREKGKALVFMGDVGSVPLGFLTGALMVDLAVSGHWAAALILPAYFLADATITLAKRISRGEKVWEAHKTHYYQRAVDAMGGAHLPVVWRIAAANVSLIAAALWSSAFPLLSLAVAGIVLLALFALLTMARR